MKPKTKRNPQGAGRPPRLEESEVMERLIQALKAGNVRHVAAAYAGIAETSFRLWMRRGKEEKSGIYVKFRQEVIRAERIGEAALVVLIQKHAKTDAKHAEWILTHHPEMRKRWAAPSRLEHTGKDGSELKTTIVANAPGDLDLEKLNDDELAQYEELAAKARRE